MDKKIRAKIKFLLLEQNLREADLARKLNITSAGISKIMNTKHSRRETLEKIAEALGVPVSYFFEDDHSIMQNVVGNNAYNVSQNVGGNKSTLEKDIEIIKLKLDLILEKIDKKVAE